MAPGDLFSLNDVWSVFTGYVAFLPLLDAALLKACFKVRCLAHILALSYVSHAECAGTRAHACSQDRIGSDAAGGTHVQAVQAKGGIRSALCKARRSSIACNTLPAANHNLNL